MYEGKSRQLIADKTFNIIVQELQKNYLTWPSNTTHLDHMYYKWMYMDTKILQKLSGCVEENETQMD